MSRPPINVRLSLWLAERTERWGDAWNRLVGPFERFFGWLGELFFGSFDSFDVLESRVVRGVGFLLWPVIATFRWIGRWLPTPAPDSLLATLPARVFGSLVGGAMWAAEKFNLDRVLFFFVWLLTPVWWPVLTVIGFLNAWLNTRNLREITLGVPAVLFASPFVYVAMAWASQSQGEIADRYKLAVRKALEAGNHQEVFLYERKLAQLGVDTRRSDYRNAVALADDGDLETAYQRMRLLAPLDRAGYVQAHAWIARQLVIGRLTEELEPQLADNSSDDTKRFELADKHLGHVTELGGGGPMILQLQALSLAGQGRAGEAADTIASLAESQRAAAATRLRWLVAAGRTEQAKEQATDLIAMLSQRRAGDELASQECEAWAVAAEMIRDEQQLEAAIAEWRRLEPQAGRPLVLLGSLRRRQADRLLGTKTATAEAVVERLGQAAELGAPSPWLLGALQRLNRLRPAQRNADLAWRRLVSKQDAPIPLREALGTIAAATNQITDARSVLSRLVGKGQASELGLNNYAWALAQEPNPDPLAALKAVDEALASRPDDYRFRETRGQILIQLKRWREAIGELELVLNRMPDAAGVHTSLAVAYEAIEQPQLAQIHREQSER